ncbi:hypothetical protein ACFLUF_01890 [Chloroflexota bacterium]
MIKFWHVGTLFITGVLLIIYIAIGFLYLQQGVQQGEFEEKIVKLNLILVKPLPDAEKLQAEYEEVNSALAPLTDSAAIATLIAIAEESGINIDENAGKLIVPSATFGRANVSGGTYQVLSFSNIYVQGVYDDVMAFISDLDSGKTLKNMVLERVTISEAGAAIIAGEEGARRAEFRNVEAVVIAMMEDNGLLAIPNPMGYRGYVAHNLMGDDPDTEGVIEGFPDVTTTVAEKGYTGTGSPRDGYVLYVHDKISTDNTTRFETVSYITTLTTEYYYTCEANGRVRQFDGPDLATAVEYLSREETMIEVQATVDVSIYTKSE